MRSEARLLRTWWRDLPALVLALPLLMVASWAILAAFTPTAEVNRGEWFRSFTLENFRLAWASADFVVLYRNTLLYVFGLLVVQLVTVTLAGYALARLRFVGREWVFQLILIQLFYPPVALILPNFLILKSIGLTDSLVGLALPYIASATGVFLLRQGFKSIPRELEEAALVDGANSLQILWKILLPQVRPQLAAFSLVSLVYHWNEFLWPLIVINSSDKRVLATGLASFTRSAESGAEWGLIAAGALLVALPLVLAFAFFQRAFVQSFAGSGLKG